MARAARCDGEGLDGLVVKSASWLRDQLHGFEISFTTLNVNAGPALHAEKTVKIHFF